jgi:NADH-quinone oxidoreductase subunit M
MQFPILSVIIFTPIVAALIIFLIPGERKSEIKVTALAAATFALGLSIWAYFSYNLQTAGYQYVEKYTWLEVLGISYHVGMDGMNAPLVLLTGIVMFTGVLISWGIDDRPREFFTFLFILATGVFGVFVSLDLFMLFFFYEIAVFPMFLLIAIWGWKVTREYAAMKLTLYLFIGSVISLVGVLAMFFGSGTGTFDMIMMESANFSVGFQRLWFPFVFLGFAVLGGIFPFHNWSPDGHVAAPTAVSMFHAGVLMKLGAFAALRVGIMLLPEGARFWMPWIIVLTLVNVVYGAFIASVQNDFKYVIGFSSVSHMGLVLMGFATLNQQGMLGAGMQMFSHGIMTALFFAVVGMVYDQTHTRDIPRLGGFRKVMPLVAIAFVVGGLVSMGMPGFSGFIAEFPIFMGLWGGNPSWVWNGYGWVAIVASISIVITASYIIRIISKVFFGNLPAEFEGHVHDVSVLDKVALVFLSAILIALGVYPSLMVPWVQSGVNNIMRLFGGA